MAKNGSPSGLFAINMSCLKLTIEAPKSAFLGSENCLGNMNVQTGRRSERQWRLGVVFVGPKPLFYSKEYLKTS